MDRVYGWGRIMRDNRGIILLEVLIGITLMSIVLFGVWGNFHKIQGRYLAVYETGQRRQEINTALEFIQKEVEGAAMIKIETSSHKNMMEVEEEIVDEQIKCIIFIPNKEEPHRNQTDLSAVLKGDTYELIYQQQTVAEEIANLTVSKARHSTLVEVSGSIQNQKGEMISQSIILSLAHKQ